MAVPNLFKFAERRKAADNPDPGGYKAAPYGSFPQDVMSDGWGWDPETARQKREDAVRERSIPKIDSNDVIGSLKGLLGPSPEERAAEEQRLQKHRRKMHGWTALFNGLRHLGNLYYAAKGAPGQKFGDPHQQIEQQYQDERKRLADIHAADRNYYGTLYNLRRQMESDRRADESLQSTLEWRKAQQEDRQRQSEERRWQFEEKLRQQQEQFEARQRQQQARFNRRQQSNQKGGAKKAGGGNGKAGGGLGWGRQSNGTIVEQEKDW